MRSDKAHGHHHAHHCDGHEVDGALDQEERDRAACDLVRRHAALAEDPRPEGEAADAARRHDRPHGQLRPAELPGRAYRHVTAEDRPEHDHVGHARQPLERHGQHEPSRAGGLEEVVLALEVVGDLDAQLAEKQASWVNARAELERQRSLHAQGLSPKQSLDAAVAAEATSRAGVRYVRALLDYTVIRAPFGGVVTAKRAFVGEAVSPFGSSPSGGGSGGAIVTLVEFSTLYVGAVVNEANLSKLGPKQPAEIALDAVPDKTYHGFLRQIVPAADRQKATVRVKVAFLDADEKILPDLSARVSFTAEPTQGRTGRTRVLVPRSAIRTVNGRTGVFRIDEGRAKFQPVKAGAETQGQVEIVEGLSGGERLVSTSSGEIRDGDRVRVEGEKS